MKACSLLFFIFREVKSVSLLDSLCDEKTWTEFYNYRSAHGNMSEKELKELGSFIAEKRFLPLAQTLEFSLPQKKMINKSGSQKKRVIYTFPDDETWVLKMLTWLLYKYDTALHKSCYSFRRTFTAHAAVSDAVRTKNVSEKWALKLDLHNYFNSMPSTLLAAELANVITDDPPLLDFLTRFFTADKAVCGESVIDENRGAMAGVPLSAFCANIYLSDLDEKFETLGVPYFRYSDDILVLTDSQQQANELYGEIKSHVESKGLSLNPEKFSLTPPHQPWEFLGFKFSDSGIDLADSSVRKMKAKIKRKTAKLLRWKNKNHLSGDKAAKAMIKVFDRKFFGKDSEHDLTWSRWFFPVLTTDAGLHALDAYLVENIRCLYTGRHYKGNYRITYDHIRSLGYKSLVGEYYKYRTSK